MQAYTLTVGDRLFRLRTPCDVTELTTRLTEAVRAGGGMVGVPVAGETAVAVLISPGVPVVLEMWDVDPGPEPDLGLDIPWLAGDDLDY